MLGTDVNINACSLQTSYGNVVVAVKEGDHCWTSAPTTATPTAAPTWAEVVNPGNMVIEGFSNEITNEYSTDSTVLFTGNYPLWDPGSLGTNFTVTTRVAADSSDFVCVIDPSPRYPRPSCPCGSNHGYARYTMSPPASHTTGAPEACPIANRDPTVNTGDGVHGFGMRVRTVTACEAAATDLGLEDTTATTEHTDDWPPGCYYIAGRSIAENPLWFNRQLGSEASQPNAAPICVGKLPVQWTVATILVGTQKAALLLTCRCPTCGSIADIDDLSFVTNAGIETCFEQGPDAGYETGELRITSNWYITTMAHDVFPGYEPGAFPRLTAVEGRLVISDNNQLVTLGNAFPVLDDLGIGNSGDSLRVWGNDALRSLGTAFASLRRIPGTLYFSENPLLTDWDALRTLVCHGGAYRNDPTANCQGCPGWLLALPQC